MTALTRLWRRFVTLVTLTRYVEYMTTLPQDLAQPGNPRAWRATTPPLDVSAWPTRYNPRATCYHPDAEAVLLSGTRNSETPPALRAAMPDCCEAMWHDSAGQRRVDGAEYEE